MSRRRRSNPPAPNSAGQGEPDAARRSKTSLAAPLLIGFALASIGLLVWWTTRPADDTARAKGGHTAGSTPGPSSEKTVPKFEDFLGAEACATCHAREYSLWKSSTHGRAGGAPNEVSPIARFDNQPLRFRDAIVTPSRTPDGNCVFHIDEPGAPRKTIRVDAVIGGGQMNGGGTQSFFQRQPDGTYRFLPFDFIRRENLWFVQLARDMTWAPISDQISLNDDLANWPPRRVLGTSSEFSNCQNCHGSQITLAHDDRDHGMATRFQTLRINCESCHGPGRRHVDIVRRPGWERQADLGLSALATASKHESMEICHQCHAAKDALRDEPYLPGAGFEDYFSLKLGLLTDSPFLPDGRVRRFSYQSNHEFSDCYLNGSMTCLDCHDPHSQTYRDVFGRPLEGRFDNRQCTGCHASKGLAPEAHSHHKPDSAGNSCVACHMPYLQHQGVGRHLTFARSDHSIPIPRPAFDQSIGIENACQKCHRDHDLAWQQSHVDNWYGRLKPHPPLVERLLDTNSPASLRDAAIRYLDPAAGHPMAQAAGLARFIAEQVRPGSTEADSETWSRLRALAAIDDPDLQALALTALQVGFSRDEPARALIARRLADIPESDPIRRRWAVAVDQLGLTFAARGDVGSALITLARALEVQPNSDVILSHFALAQFQNQQPSDAIATLQRAITVRPTKAVLHFQLAQLLLQAGRSTEAVAALETGLKHAPHDEHAQALLQKLRPPRP